MTIINWINGLGIYLVWTGILDGWKYVWNAKAIIKTGTAKGHSRKFINCALHNDQVRIIYLILVGIYTKQMDWYLLFSSIFALATMCYLWWIIYLYYPYRYRNLLNWKRPNIFIYFWNSLLPNRLRKRL